MKKIIFLFLFLISIANAKCSNNELSLSLPDNTSLKDVLNSLSKE
jgi:hypothetical protein